MSIAASAVAVLSSLLLSMRNYRTHTLLAFRGEFHKAHLHTVAGWTPLGITVHPSLPSPPPQSQAHPCLWPQMSGLRYMGTQFGYIIWGLILLIVAFFSIGFTLQVIAILVFHYHETDFIWDAAERSLFASLTLTPIFSSREGLRLFEAGPCVLPPPARRAAPRRPPLPQSRRAGRASDGLPEPVGPSTRIHSPPI